MIAIPALARRLATTAPVALIALLAPPLRAELSWESREIDATPKPADERVVSEFRFTNAGSAPVTIASVRPSCSCTTAKLDKTVYQPGESGVIAATFTIGDRSGEQRKTIVVKTDDAEHPSDSLVMRVHLPPQPDITPRVLAWRVGQPREPRAIEITLPAGLQASVDGASVVAGNGGSFACELVTVEAGRHWRLQVTPPAGDEVASATIAIATSVKTYHVYAHLTKPVEPVPPASAPPAAP